MERTRRRVLFCLLFLLVLLIGADLFVEHHASFWIEGTPGFAAWFGLSSAALAVAVAWGWARLMRRPGESSDD